MDYKIEDGVPIPALRTAQAKYPWRLLEVGQSFFVPDKTGRQLSTACVAARKSTGFQFAVRTVDGGCRIWRTK